MTRWWVVLALIAPAASSCDEPRTAIPGLGPFVDIHGEVSLGDPASVVSARRGVAVNDAGQLVEYAFSKDWLYLFPNEADSVPPKPTERLVGVQARENVGDTITLWRRWHDLRQRVHEARGGRPTCTQAGGPLNRVTEVNFDGVPGITVAAQIDHEEDGIDYEAHLIVTVRLNEGEAPPELGRAGKQLDCEALPGVFSN